GMAPDDLALSVERHSTSKLRDETDLFRVSTLGFRGEALPSIGSVAKLDIISRPLDSATGYRIRVEGGRKEELRASAASVGTTVEIRDIFFNTPARRKFLKSPTTELSHVCDIVNRTALAYPAVHFRLHHDGRNLADYVPAREPTDRLRQVLGADIARNLTYFSSDTGGLQITGYLSATPASYPNARYVFTFVNGRYVRDKVLTHAVMQGYETLLMKGQYPAVVLYVAIPYEEVDVNVHPAKYEVRFRRQNDVHGLVARAIHDALQARAKEPRSHPVDAHQRDFPLVAESGFPYAPLVARDVPACDFPTVFSMPVQAQAAPDGFFSSMTILGQILGCYVVCASARGLSLIDQHAAHERVAFEKLRRQMEESQVEQQNLLIPQALELSAGELLLLERKLSVLERFGFLIEPFGPSSYAITAAPALLPEADYVPTVREMIAELAEIDDSTKVQRHLEERLATIACHSVIRANRKLEPDELRALLAELDRTDHATQCPHGRPVLIEFSREQLDRLFKRIV
ncbi:MAG TPA: DNA mismatch repair endonuclease MutL, partial [Candidatus Binatia bacterium]|nr:DNA mismatch repair endonuclease MutL [Candidatus Binatia bacterium]